MRATNKETTTGNAFVHSALLTGVSDPVSVKEEVFKKFEQVRLGNNEAVAFKKLSEGSEKPYWLINGHTYIINSGGGSVSWDTIANTILVDGKKMSPEQFNLQVKRSSITNLAAKRYGTNEYLFEVGTTSATAGNQQ